MLFERILQNQSIIYFIYYLVVNKVTNKVVNKVANKNGYATLYFGVKDNGDVIGQQIGNLTLRDISQAIVNYIKPQVSPTITLELIDDKNIIKVYVEGNDTPYSASGKYYIRSADEDRELSPEQLRKLLSHKIDIDPIIRMPSNNPSLTLAQLKTLYAIKGLSINDLQFEVNNNLLLENGKYNYMAELLADKNDISIKVVTFKGIDKRNVIKRNEYGYKCLLNAMDQVISYVEYINETSVFIDTHQRQEHQLFNMSCFKEAWVNACLHTRWDKKNPPAVYIFSNRIEIIFTGGLPVDLTEDEFYKGISKPVNLSLQKIFGQLGYVEQTGHGIPLIISEYGKLAFDISQNFITVTIPFNKNFITKTNSEVFEENLNTSELKLLELLQNNPKFTINDLVNESGFSNGYVRKLLNQLKNKEYIKREESNKLGYWNVMF